MKRQQFFNVQSLRVALSDALGHEPAGLGVPFSSVQFIGEHLVQFSLEGVSWQLDLDTYTATKLRRHSNLDVGEYLISEQSRITPEMFYKESFTGLGKMPVPESASPDFKWFASVKDNNIALRATVDGRTVMLTDDGSEEFFWDVETTKWHPWSSDGQRLAVFKIDTKGMARIPAIKWLKPLEESLQVLTIPAGGTLYRSELYILDVSGSNPVLVDLGNTSDQYLRVLGWTPDNRELIFARYDRLLTQIEIMGANPISGTTRVIMKEKSSTWLTNQHEAIWASDTGFCMLPDGSGFIWRSERDGWNHLYYYNMESKLVRRLTRGKYPVNDVTRIDQRGGWVYFQAHGDAERPYDFDPAKKYPVIEYIYAGPQTTWRKMDFGLIGGPYAASANYPLALAQLGFITLTMDGRGTPGRSKAFHDVVYRNWGQFEIDDHAGAIKQLGQRIGALDLSRVGITGGSWGGHFTVRGLVQAPELYKAGVAEVPGFDSRAFTLYEPYLGMPGENKKHYDAADALVLAPMLKGKLLMTGGLNGKGTQKDVFKMSEALIRLGIEHEVMNYPNSGHGYFGKSAAYNRKLKKRWFTEQLNP